jgi:hypothetical protein
MRLLSVVQMPTPSRVGPLSDNQLLLVVLALALFFGLFWVWNRKAKKWLEQTGRLEEIPDRLDWLARGPQENSAPAKLRYSEQEFQEIVSKALDEVPPEGGFPSVNAVSLNRGGVSGLPRRQDFDQRIENDEGENEQNNGG